MSAGIPRPSSIENVSTTLSSGITDVATTATVDDASNIVAPCYLVIDRVDASGTLKNTALWEYVKVTNVAGSDLTITRAQNGSTGQAHSSGAVVEAVVTSAMFEEWYDVLNPEHDSAGGHVITGTATIAGMNLASVATIAAVSTDRLDVSNATIIGVPLTPVFVFTGNLSGPTTLLQTPLPLPRSGQWSHANVITRTVASGASVIIDVNLNGSSIFEAGTRPAIAAGGTFVSTASINTPVFTKGDRLSWDSDIVASENTHITDLDVILVSK